MELAGGFHTLDGEKSSDLEASDSEASDYGDGASSFAFRLRSWMESLL